MKKLNRRYTKMAKSKTPEYKFNEGALIEELRSYIDATYTGHYSRNKFQSTEFISDCGHGIGFAIGNILKYAQRYGRKGNPEDHRKDLQRSYTMLLLRSTSTIRTQLSTIWMKTKWNMLKPITLNVM